MSNETLENTQKSKEDLINKLKSLLIKEKKANASLKLQLDRRNADISCSSANNDLGVNFNSCSDVKNKLHQTDFSDFNTEHNLAFLHNDFGTMKQVVENKDILINNYKTNNFDLNKKLKLFMSHLQPLSYKILGRNYEFLDEDSISSFFEKLNFESFKCAKCNYLMEQNSGLITGNSTLHLSVEPPVVLDKSNETTTIEKSTNEHFTLSNYINETLVSLTVDKDVSLSLDDCKIVFDKYIAGLKQKHADPEASKSSKSNLFTTTDLIFLVDVYREFCTDLIKLLPVTINEDSLENGLNGSDLKNYLNQLLCDINMYLQGLPNTDKQLHFKTAAVDTMVNVDSVNYELNSRDDLSEHLKCLTSEGKSDDHKSIELEALISALKSQLYVSDEKVQRMKVLLVRAKLEAAEHHKNVLQLQKIETLKADHAIDLENIYDKLAELNIIKKELECSVSTLRAELSETKSNKESLKIERDLMADKLIKLQNEHNAYKVKVQYALHKTQTNDRETRLNTSSNDGDLENEDTYLNTKNKEIEFLKECLLDSKQNVEEAEMRISLAKTEAELLKQELDHVKNVYEDLSRSCNQKESWDVQLQTLTRNHEKVLAVQMEQLNKNTLEQRLQFEEKMRCQQESHENELKQERQLWESKFNCLNFEKEELVLKLENLCENEKHDENAVPFHTMQKTHLFDRAQGDGADCLYESKGANFNLDEENECFAKSASIKCLSVFESSRNRINLPSLEQLLNKSDTYAKTCPSTNANLSPNARIKNNLVQSAMHTSSYQSVLATHQRRVECLSEMLNESEITMARILEQNQVLKEEIRRLQQQQIASGMGDIQQDHSENSSTVSNDPKLPMYHVKSLLLQIMRLPHQSNDRLQLMNTLAMFLCLQPDEIKMFQVGLKDNLTTDDGQHAQHSKTVDGQWTFSKMLGL